MADKQPTAIIFGVRSERGLGAAVCRRVAAEGYHVFAGGRTPDRLDKVVGSIVDAGGSAEAVTVDVTSEGDVADAFERTFAPSPDRAAPDLIVYNVGANRMIEFLALEASDFEAFWRVGCFGGFLVGREAARRMAPLGRGTVLFTGASGSMRGKPNFAHFAAAKAGLRMLSQSMAREFGPQGLHVAHAVIDGGIDGDVIRANVPDIVEQRGEDGLLDVDAIADTYWMLHRQHPSAWTQEIDLRPFKEYF